MVQGWVRHACEVTARVAEDYGSSGIPKIVLRDLIQFLSDNPVGTYDEFVAAEV